MFHGWAGITVVEGGRRQPEVRRPRPLDRALFNGLPCILITQGKVVPSMLRLRWALAAIVVLTFLPTPTLAQDEAARNDTYLEFVALGDADGDGRGDILQVEETYTDDGSSMRLVAHPGSDPTRDLWTLSSDEDRFVPMPDLDGDGVADVARITSAGTGDSVGAPVPAVGSVYRSSFDFTGDYEFLSGVDLHAMGTVSVGQHLESTDAFLYAPFVGGVWAWRQNYVFSSLGLRDVGTVTLAQDSWNWTAAWPLLPVGGPGVEQQDDDISVAGYAVPDGHQLYARTFAHPARTSASTYPARADLDGDGVTDAAVADLLDLATPAQSAGLGVHLYKPTYMAFGAKGDLWSVERDPILDLYGPIPVGDLDGDGAIDLEVLEVTLDAMTTLLLSGRSGTILGQHGDANIVSMVVALGDADLDGDDEGLYVAYGDGDTAQLGSSGADLAPTWTTTIAEGDQVIGPGLARDEGSINFTGDAGVDVVLLRGLKGDIDSDIERDNEAKAWTASMAIDPYHFTWEVLEGSSGKVAWSAEQGDVYNAVDCGDIDGRGGADLCLALIQGESQDLINGRLAGARLSLKVLAGEDGATLLDQELRGPASTPLGDVGRLSVEISPMGDLSGDGADDLAVAIGTVPTHGNGTRIPAPATSWYFLSLDAGQRDLAASNAAGDVGPIVIAPPGETASALPEPDAAATLAAGVKGKDKGAPAPAMTLLAAALAAAALVRRRRA